MTDIRRRWRSLKQALPNLPILSVLSLVVAGLSAWFTWRQAAISRDALLASNRAWMNVELKRPFSLTWDKNENHALIVNLNLFAQNVGHSPALNVEVTAYPKFGEGPFSKTFGHPSDQVGTTKETCSSRDTAQHNIAVFPEKSYEESTSIYLPPSDFDDYLQHWKELYNKRSDTVYSLRIIMYVRYQIDGDSAIHHTGRLFHVSKLKPETLPPCCYVLEVGRDEDDNHLLLDQFTTGDYAD